VTHLSVVINMMNPTYVQNRPGVIWASLYSGRRISHNIFKLLAEQKPRWVFIHPPVSDEPGTFDLSTFRGTGLLSTPKGVGQLKNIDRPEPGFNVG